MKKGKRILGLLLVSCIVIAMIPTVAFVAGSSYLAALTINGETAQNTALEFQCDITEGVTVVSIQAEVKNGENATLYLCPPSGETQDGGLQAFTKTDFGLTQTLTLPTADLSAYAVEFSNSVPSAYSIPLRLVSEDGQTERNYNIFLQIVPPSQDTTIKSFCVQDQFATNINYGVNTVEITLPYRYHDQPIVPIITLSCSKASYVLLNETSGEPTDTLTVGDNNILVVTSESEKCQRVYHVIVNLAVASVLSPPEPKSLVYTGKPQELVSAGTVSSYFWENCTMQYSLDGENYSQDIPTGTNAGDYTVYYKAVGDGEYFGDSEASSLNVSIARAEAQLSIPSPAPVTYGVRLSDIPLENGWAWTDSELVPTVSNSGYSAIYTVPDYTNYDWSNVDGYDPETHAVTRTISLTVNRADPLVMPPVAKENLIFTGKPQEIVLAGSVTGGTIQYSLDNKTYSAEIPTATNAGSYTVWYKVLGDEVHTDLEPLSLSALIAKASRPEKVPKDTTVPYGTTLSEIDLPNGWTWKTPDQSLVTGDNSVTAVYSDTTNYELTEVSITVTVSEPIHVHNPIKTAAKEATCTADGNLEYWTCSGCGNIFMDEGCTILVTAADVKIKALGHNLGGWVGTKAPTCAEKGGEKRACSRCDYSETREIAALGHAYIDAVTAPTCTEGGYTTHTCSVCGDSYTDSETAALGHAYRDTVTAPTCTEQGYTTHTCSVCGNEVIDTATPALGHDYQLNSEKSVAAVPGKGGYDYYECSRDPAHFYTVPVFAPIVTHTATFMVGEEVIGVVTFEEGSVTLEEPKLPERKNYVGHWESYDLANAKTDITVHGQYTPVDPDKVSDVESGAETEYADGVATITLTAAAASKTIKVVSETTTPVDVVLVLDQSGSMAENLSRYDRQSKRDALVDCAEEFVQSLYENAVKTGADHRVAVTGFAYSAYNRGKYENTGLLATPSGNAIKYDNIKDSDYQSALLPINNGGEINQNVLSGIDSIVADGATAADLGLRMAQNIFAENPTQGKRQRIVIFITDGTPTSWGESTSLVTQTAADAISVANNIKNGQDGKIYCVGVHANGNSSTAFTSDKDGVKTDWFGGFVSYDFNRFLHAISSNYPDSKSMSSLGDGDKNDGYYMAVNDTGDLGNIFTNILYSTVYDLKTFDKATFHYTLPTEFTLTIEQEMALREELKETHGITDEDIVTERKADGTTELQFFNIPTKEAYDETGALIHQAEVTFKVTANQKASGSTGTGVGDIQYDGSTVTEFVSPTVEVPADRHLLVFAINGQVYQITEAELGDSITVPDSRLASWSIIPGTVVDSKYTIFEATTVSDTKYRLTWNMNETKLVQQYQFGESITPPDPSACAPSGYEFSRWSRSIPATMPAYDLKCTAIYSPAHVHEFIKAYQTGDCDEGITTIFRCACGEEKQEQATPEEHNYTAVFSDNGYSGNTMEKLVCTKCGHSEEKNITFKVAYSESRRTTVLDLSLYENQVSVSEPDKEIELRFYIGGDDGKRYTITRIDPDGKRTKYQGVSENGYLVFRANHFSIYVIGELDEAGQETEEIDYEQATEILDSKVDATEPEKPTPPAPSASSSSSSAPSKPTVSAGNGGKAELSTDGTVLTIIPDKGYEIEKITVNGGEMKVPANGKLTGLQPTDTVEITFTKVWENPYTDVPRAKWYFKSVRYVTENGLMGGCGNGKFDPGADLTRAELAQVLYNRAGRPTVAENSAFTDVADNAWYFSAATWAAVDDVVSGYGNGKFGPNDPITREQLAMILWRADGKPETAGSLDSFTDSGKASDWAVPALQWAVEQKIISGKGNGILDPKGNAARAEVASMFMRYCTF